MKFTFEVLIPEEEISFVSGPQILVFETEEGGKNVIVYFMENSAFEIVEGSVVPAWGKVKLFYSTASANNALTASSSVRKVVFKFANSQGMANRFEFHHQKT